jgi:chromosome segregation ATPase
MDKLRDGLLNRHVGVTRMNAESSRSHSVFTIKIKSRQSDSTGVVHKKTSYLHLIDLAGSERQQSTGTEGDRFKEACNINKTLSQLAMVINHLTEAAKGKQLHIPYRDSKLTYLLKDSLGGNSKTVIIANVSPSASHAFESVQTLEFAKRAKNIKNRPMVNEVQKGDINALQRRIQLLEEQLAQQQFQPQTNTVTTASVSQSDKEDYEKRMALHIERVEQCERLQDYLQSQVEQYAKIAEGKEMLLHATRLALKLKECSLAKIENREPDLGTSILKLDYLHDFDLEDDFDSDVDMDDDEDMGIMRTNVERKELSDVQRLQKLVKKVFHPDRHPTVISFAMENYELREKLAKYESEEEKKGSNAVAGSNEPDAYTRVLEQQLYELIKSKHSKVQELEEEQQLTRQRDEETMTSASNQIQKLQQELNSLQTENLTLTQQLHELMKQQEQMVSIQEAQSKIAEIQKHQEDMMPLHEVEQIIQELESTKSQRDSAHNRCVSLEVQIDGLKAQLDSISKHRDELQMDMNNVQEAEESLRSQLQNIHETQNENALLKGEVEQLRAQLKRWKLEYEQEFAKTSETSNTIAGLMQQCNEHKRALNHMSDEQEEWKRAEMIKNHEISVLSQELAELHLTVQELQSRLDLEHRRYNALEKKQHGSIDNQEVVAREQQLKNIIAELEQKLQTMQEMNQSDETKELQRKLDEKMHQMNQIQSAHNVDIQSFGFERSTWQTEVKLLRETIDHMQIERIESESAIRASMNAKIDKLKLDRESLRTSLMKTESQIEMLEQDLKQINNTSLRIDKCEKDVEMVEQKLSDELQFRLDLAKQQEIELRTHSEQLKVSNYCLSARIEELEIALAMKQTCTVEHTQILMETEKFRIAKQQIIDGLTERCSHLESVLATCKDEFEQIAQQKLREFSSEKAALLTSIQEDMAEKETAQKELAELRTRNATLEKENGELMGHRNPRQKIQQVVKIKQENSDLKAQIRQLQLQLEQTNKFSLGINKENDSSFVIHRPMQSSSSKLNSSTLNTSKMSTKASAAREVEQLRTQMSKIEDAVLSLTKVATSKKRKMESPAKPSPAKSRSTFDKIMQMLNEIEFSSGNSSNNLKHRVIGSSRK